MRYRDGKVINGEALDLVLPTEGRVEMRDAYLGLIGSGCELRELRKKIVEAGIAEEDQTNAMCRTLFGMCFHADPRLADDNFFQRPRTETRYYLTQAGKEYLEAKAVLR